MDVFRTDRIRNVVLLGHGGAGKTTLAEAMAYLSGMTNRLGRVEDGNTVSDYDKVETKCNLGLLQSECAEGGGIPDHRNPEASGRLYQRYNCSQLDCGNLCSEF